MLAIGLGLAGVMLAGAVVGNTVREVGVATDRPAAQVAEAWSLLRKSPSAADYAKAEALAKDALDRNPLQSSAASLLGALHEQRGDKAGAATFMKIAAGLNRRDDVADLWLFTHYMERREFEPAIRHADALLRRKFFAVQDAIYPRILVNANTPALVDAVGRRMAKNPEWRSDFLNYAATKFTDPSSAFVLYSALQTAGGRPTATELRPYLQRLLAAKKYEEAYLSWVLFLPQETLARMEAIYDGNFEGLPDTAPFGWELGQGVRGSIESAAAYDRPGYALRIDYDGMAAPKLPRQILVLPPGTYRFSGRVLTTGQEAAGRMEWTIHCDGAPSLLPSQPVPSTKRTWKSFTSTFTVPDACKGQWLELKPIPGGQRANIEVWFDDLAIQRVQADG